MNNKVKLGSVCSFYSGTGFPLQYQGNTQGKYPFYKVGDISRNYANGSRYLSDAEHYIDDEVLYTIKGQIIPANTVVFAKIGEAVKLNRRAITSQECLIDNNATGIKPNESQLDLDYFFHFMCQLKLEKYAEATTVPSVKKSSMEKLEIPLLPLNEQKEIAKILDKVTALISLRKKQLEKLDELVKSRFIEMFGDMIHNSNNWERVALGDVCDVRDGTHDSPKYYDEGYPLVTSKNVTGGIIDFTDCSLICREDYEKINERSKVDFGDILMPMIGTVGKPIIVNVKCEFAIKNVALIKFCSDCKVINIFVKALLQSDYFDTSVLNKIRGGTQKFIALGDIRKLVFFLPPLELQEQFATFVAQTDKSKLAVQKSLEQLETLKKSLMQKYFG